MASIAIRTREVSRVEKKPYSVPMHVLKESDPTVFCFIIYGIII